jgi:hypothetical protein
VTHPQPTMLSPIPPFSSRLSHLLHAIHRLGVWCAGGPASLLGTLGLFDAASES